MDNNIQDIFKSCNFKEIDIKKYLERSPSFSSMKDAKEFLKNPNKESLIKLVKRTHTSNFNMMVGSLLHELYNDSFYESFINFSKSYEIKPLEKSEFKKIKKENLHLLLNRSGFNQRKMMIYLNDRFSSFRKRMDNVIKHRKMLDSYGGTRLNELEIILNYENEHIKCIIDNLIITDKEAILSDLKVTYSNDYDQGTVRERDIHLQLALYKMAVIQFLEDSDLDLPIEERIDVISNSHKIIKMNVDEVIAFEIPNFINDYVSLRNKIKEIFESNKKEEEKFERNNKRKPFDEYLKSYHDSLKEFKSYLGKNEGVRSVTDGPTLLQYMPPKIDDYTSHRIFTSNISIRTTNVNPILDSNNSHRDPFQ